MWENALRYAHPTPLHYCETKGFLYNNFEHTLGARHFSTRSISLLIKLLLFINFLIILIPFAAAKVLQNLIKYSPLYRNKAHIARAFALVKLEFFVYPFKNVKNAFNFVPADKIAFSRRELIPLCSTSRSFFICSDFTAIRFFTLLDSESTK